MEGFHSQSQYYVFEYTYVKHTVYACEINNAHLYVVTVATVVLYMYVCILDLTCSFLRLSHDEQIFSLLDSSYHKLSGNTYPTGHEVLGPG